MSGETDPYPLLRTLGYSTKSHIVVKDPCHTEQLLSQLSRGGFDKLQVVADFDYTMTRVFDADGQRCHCSWGVLDNSPLMPEFYRTETQKLLAKYYPMEVSATMTEEEKIPHMMEWYKQVHDLLVRCNLTKEIITATVANSNTKLRIGSEELLEELCTHGVPLLVFSAGMGDILKQILRKFNLETSNVKVVSNFFKFDEQDRVIGFHGDMIHMFNKNENAIHSSPYFEELKARHNVILLGDSLGDIQMARGVPSPNTILKIGFLNDKSEAKLALYQNAFDIVLVDDQSMDVVSAVVSFIRG